MAAICSAISGDILRGPHRFVGAHAIARGGQEGYWRERRPPIHKVLTNPAADATLPVLSSINRAGWKHRRGWHEPDSSQSVAPHNRSRDLRRNGVGMFALAIFGFRAGQSREAAAAAHPCARSARVAALPSRSGRSAKDAGGVGHARRAACNFRPSGCRTIRMRPTRSSLAASCAKSSISASTRRMSMRRSSAIWNRPAISENRDLFVFDYDWRRSVFDNAEALDRFVREKAPDGKVDILAHSMGALVARVYVMEGRRRLQHVARLFSAGAPFQGSVKVFQTVEKRMGRAQPRDGRARRLSSHDTVVPVDIRTDAALSAVAAMPAALRHSTRRGRRPGKACAGTASISPPCRTWQRPSRASIRSKRWSPRPIPKNVEDVLLIGVDQRTPQRVAFETAAAGAVCRCSTTWAGDGTVLRDSAVLETAAAASDQLCRP